MKVAKVRQAVILLATLLVLQGFVFAGTHAAPRATQESEVTNGNAQWDFNNLQDWRGIAKVTEDSAQIIIGLEKANLNKLEQVEALVATYGSHISNTIKAGGETVAAVVDVPFNQMPLLVNAVKRAGLSKYIEPNLLLSVDMEPNDPGWTYQWGPKKIEANWAWNTTTGSSSILVAVVDTGIDYDHPDLEANYLNGYDWVNMDPDPMDDRGHGTHCAGIIAGVINNGEGMAGLAQIRLLAEKCFDSAGSGNVGDVANGINHAVESGAKIVSMSFRMLFASATLYNAIKNAYDNGVLLVASAGNSASDKKQYPAAYDEVIAVTATDEQDNLASFSNFGNWVELAAPGVNIYSTYWDNTYKNASGTSMAAPHVAGVAALAWTRFYGMPRDWVRAWLRSSTDDLGPPGFDPSFGYGRINARKAVENAPPTDDVLVLNWQQPAFSKPQETVTTSARIVNFGSNSQADTHIWMYIDEALYDDETVAFLPYGGSAIVNFTWVPETVGKYNVSVRILPVPNEINVANNAVWQWTYVDTVIRVPQHFAKIQGATYAARPGDTILVGNGTYYESVTLSTSNVTITGQTKEGTILDDSDTVGFSVGGDGNVITNFTLRGGGIALSYGCIVIYGSNNVVCNNMFLPWGRGVTIRENFGNTVKDNDFGPGGGIAFTLYKTRLNTIKNNRIQNVTFGVGVTFSDENTIEWNKIIYAQWAIVLGSSVGNKIRANHMKNNEGGVQFSNSSNNVLYWNNFINNPHQVEIADSVNRWQGYWNVTGNHWSDYAGTQFDSHLVGITPYYLDQNNEDLHPLKSPYLQGDIVHDGRVDIKDIARAAKAYGSYPGHPNWNPHADIDENGKVDIRDISAIAKNFGETWQTYWQE